MTIFVIIFAFLVPVIYDSDWGDDIAANLPTFRFVFMVIFVLASTGFCIKVFKVYKVNYLFIFELDPHYKMTHIQIFRVNIYWLY